MATKKRKGKPTSEHTDEESDDGAPATGSAQSKTAVTLSGILNAIDGITSQVRDHHLSRPILALI
jgi:hypothetical protein